MKKKTATKKTATKKTAAKKQASTASEPVPKRTFQVLRTKDNHLVGEVTGYHVDLIKTLEDGTSLKLVSASEVENRGLESSGAKEE